VLREQVSEELVLYLKKKKGELVAMEANSGKINWVIGGAGEL